ncbi:hypothetical protein BSKO_06202 [Bryopsis sp. KO-2023]|nr:hypothetical protein BSKO_06202 [Bryopsis sp. KO-2023]
MDPLQQGDRFVFQGSPQPPPVHQPAPLRHSGQDASADAPLGWTSHSLEQSPLPPGLLPPAGPPPQAPPVRIEPPPEQPPGLFPPGFVVNLPRSSSLATPAAPPPASSNFPAPPLPSLLATGPAQAGNNVDLPFAGDSFLQQHPLTSFSTGLPDFTVPGGQAFTGVGTTAFASQFVPLPSLASFSPVVFSGGATPLQPPIPGFIPNQIPVCIGNGMGQQEQEHRFLSRIPPSEPPREKGPLHDEIQHFSRGCLPTAQEAAAMDSLLRDLDRRIRRMFPQATDVLLYGSQATGVALPCSDLDIVILGVGTQIFAPAEQFTVKDKKRVIQKLQHLQDNLERNDHLEVGKCQVVSARVPVMKATLKSKGLEFKTDISMGVRNAAAAVGLICQHVSRNPAIRPLVLVLKAILKQAGLNEVFTGGISSYVLFNLVVAHLMLEGVICDEPVEPGKSFSDIGTMTERARVLADQVDLCVWDLGHLLMSFLDRYGNWTAPQNKNLSISIAKGGLCLKQDLENTASCLLCVEDPQALGRNATGGSFKMGTVLDTFQEAAEKLRAAIDGNDNASLSKETKFKILSSLIPCEDIVAHIPIPSKMPKSNSSKRGGEWKSNKRRHSEPPPIGGGRGCGHSSKSNGGGGGKSRKCHRDARPMDRFVTWGKHEKQRRRRY